MKAMLIKHKFLGVDFQIRHQESAWFVLGVKKSGSTLLNNSVMFMSQRNDANWVSFPDELFLNNIDFEKFEGDFPKGIFQKGNAYGGFRYLPRALEKVALFRTSPKVLMVRDPRDALVSLYYSYLYNHYMPPGDDNEGARLSINRYRKIGNDLSIDQFVVQESVEMNDVLMNYGSLLNYPKTLILKYEEQVFSKADMLLLVAKHFNWSINQNDIHDILVHIDVIPDGEDPNRFIRRVLPGDHKEKLRFDTIQTVNEILQPSMKLFGYI